MTRRISRLASCVLLLLLAALPARAEDLLVGGTGSSGPLIEILFKDFQKQAPGIRLRLAAPPLGSNGALRALAQGRLHLVMVGRPLTSQELGGYGQHFDLADTPFVMASSDGQRRKGFTLDELARVYEGTLDKWDDGSPIRLIVRGAFESDTLLLKDMSPALARSQEVARTRPGMAGAVNDIETATLLSTTRGSFGPTTLGLLTTMGLNLQLFPLNGVTPSTNNLKNGTYPWHKRLTVVLPLNPTPAASSFAAYMRSPRGRELMLHNDYLPLAP